MRKQYHFWPAGHGSHYDAWDVDRLIALSRNFPITQVAVASIGAVDTDYWTDAEAGPTVRRIIEHLREILAVDPAYPIILGVDGRVMDGMHRICRAILAERPMIDAVRFEVHPEPDYRNVRPEELPY